MFSDRGGNGSKVSPWGALNLPAARGPANCVLFCWKDEGGVGGSRTSVVLVQATKRVEREEEFSPTMGIPSCFLMGVSVICVQCRRHVATSCGQFRVRTDLVQRDIFTVQYNFFNFGVIKFISDVNPHNLGVNINPNNVNQV